MTGRHFIPAPVLAVASEVVAPHYKHRELDVLFMERGLSPAPSPGDKITRCMAWLKMANEDPEVNPIEILGAFLERLEVEEHRLQGLEEADRQRVSMVLARHGLVYQGGGAVVVLENPTANRLTADRANVNPKTPRRADRYRTKEQKIVDVSCESAPQTGMISEQLFREQANLQLHTTTEQAVASGNHEVVISRPMVNFFISYTSIDKPQAEWIAWHLEQDGYTTIIQAWDFRPGQNFVLEMQSAAARAERTIAVLSQDYLDAVFTHPEWAAAFAQDPKGEKSTLLPVRVAPCDLKGLLSQVVHIDLVGKNEIAAKAELLAGVKQERAKPAMPPTFPGFGMQSHHAPEQTPGSQFYDVLPSAPGRIRLIHEARLATSTDEETHLPALYDGLNEALRVLPLAIGVNPRWREAPPFFDSKTPWVGPQPYFDQGVLISFSSTNIRPPGEYRARLSKTPELCLGEYIDHEGHHTISARYVAQRITSFIVFARIAMRTTLGLSSPQLVPMRFKWSLREVGGASCHCPGWATAPSPVLGDVSTALAYAPTNVEILATKAHLDKGTPRVTEFVGEVVRDLLFRFEVMSEMPGRIKPPADGLDKIVESVLNASASLW